MASARAKHILVDSEEKAFELKKAIEAGADFGDIARKNSLCPSRNQGGDLGTFFPGQMVHEFDQAVFSGAAGDLVGPVRTQFGYHLIEITERD